MFKLKIVLALVVVSVLAFGLVGLAWAGNPNGTGQPSQSCGSSTASSSPGNSSAASGSAFNPDGTAGSHYAGTQPQNSNNPASVSQYDVACYQVSQPH